MSKISEKNILLADNPSQIIGSNLRNLRLMHEYSQRQIAEFLNVSFQQVQKYEKGSNRLPIEKFFQLKTFFDVPYDYFFWGVGEEFSAENRPQDKLAYQCFLDIKNEPSSQSKKKIFKIIKVLSE